MVRAADQTGGISPNIRPVAQPQSAQAEVAAAGPSPVLSSDTRAGIPETIAIKRGDSLSILASRYRLSLAQLRSLNPQLFTTGTDESGKKRAADGGLIYPGDEIRLRTAEPAPATSEKVVQAAKSQIDQATKKPETKQTEDMASLLSLIPATDPQHGAYRQKVGDLLATLDTPAAPSSFQSASDAFNAAVSAYQTGQKAGKPPTDPIQADAYAQALGAYSRATSAVQQLSASSDKEALSEQLRIMEFTLTQLTTPPSQGSAPTQPGTSTPLPLGQLPGMPPASTQPMAIPPQAVMPPQSLPVSIQPEWNGQPQGAGAVIIKDVTAEIIKDFTPAPVVDRASASKEQASSTSPSTQGPPKKDPNDPKVQQIWKALEQADHKAIRDMASNFDLLYASLPEQKALMVKKLLEGWTSGDDQIAIAKIVDLAAKQGENEAFVKELDRLHGGEHKGVLRMLEDLGRSLRDKVVCRLLDEPPTTFAVTYSHDFYAAVVAALNKTDVETLCEALGTKTDKGWLTRISADLRQALADKLKSWWPFGGNSSAISALTAGLTTNH